MNYARYKVEEYSPLSKAWFLSVVFPTQKEAEDYVRNRHLSPTFTRIIEEKITNEKIWPKL